ncbi:MAG: hypothetical protein DRP71_10985 [Verrucomicrobia bacterium]|nr:MAG: hypothetical protein DRP71_10985 [Verrucomicrobiota bacterium]
MKKFIWEDGIADPYSPIGDFSGSMEPAGLQSNPHSNPDCAATLGMTAGMQKALTCRYPSGGSRSPQ